MDEHRLRVCAACLLAIAAQPGSAEYPTVTAAPSSAPFPEADGRLKAGQIFGAYRIERLLGRGGMGEVYEAEHVADSRRVALKVVSTRLADPADRARFMREGQLAASVNHPNSVYIFGAEEIEGAPVISMELLAGGTLKDRVEHNGPLSPAQAVDAILQVISGLDAAHQAGVLHRDIKPSNCFVDVDGTVKIGDFGLSISTLSHRVGAFTESAVIRGTPQFAAPEQLKGEPLDVRADIYAVGGTLYYLLTGRAAFEADTLTALIARVLSETAPSARDGGQDVPPGLDRILRRCLAKDPAERPQDYATLYRALEPFSTGVPAPAPFNLRCTAGAIDHVLLFPLTGAVLVGAHWMSLEAQAAAFVASVVYFSVLEGRWGASLGKRLCGLRVARTAPPGPVDMGRAMTRAVVYTAASHASSVMLFVLDSAGRASPFAGARLAGWLLSFVLLALLFSTARRSNGFASLYDLLTGTRVVVRGARHTPQLSDLDVPALATTASDVRVIGPYRILGEFRTPGPGRLFVASDDVLQRRVWIQWDAAAPVLSVRRRELARPGRLRWLAGGRRDGGGWNAYEAPDGALLTAVATTPQPWTIVKRWMHDLAREIVHGAADGTLPSFGVDRVWITRRGVPIVLDWDIAQPTAAAFAPDPGGAQRFLRQVAAVALKGLPGGDIVPVPPLPLHARRALQRLEDSGFESLAALRAALADVADGVDAVSSRRRAASMVFPGLVLLVIGIVTLIMGWFAARAGSAELPYWLDERAALQRRGTPGAPRKAEALDVYLAGLYGSDLRSAAFWSTPRGRARRTMRPSIQRMLDTRPAVTSRELAWATGVLQPDIDRRTHTAPFALDVTGLAWMFAMQAAAAAGLAAIAAFVSRGGLVLRWWDIGVTSRGGDPVSRRRAAIRSIVAWSPWLASGALMLGPGLPPQHAAGTVAAALLVTAAGAMYAVLKPERGWQDRLAGTWLVPR